MNTIRGKYLDRDELSPIGRFEPGHRLQRDRHQIDDDEQDQQPVGQADAEVADRPVLEDLVDAPPQFKSALGVRSHVVRFLLPAADASRGSRKPPSLARVR